MLIKHINKLLLQKDLSNSEIAHALQSMISDAPVEQVSAFLALFAAKDVSINELYNLFIEMQKRINYIKIGFPVLDIVGTGGDGANTVNISTASALLAASCGVKVAKHGNRSVSSLSGSADVLENLGINIHISEKELIAQIKELNFTFLYAPKYHEAFTKLKKIRKNLKISTVFNLLGPVLNPCRAQYLLLGVANNKYLNPLADLIVKIGYERAWIFYCQGVDELTTIAPSQVIEVIGKNKQTFSFDPKAYEFDRCSLEDLGGGSPFFNAKKILQCFSGVKHPGLFDTLILNAGVACYLYGRASCLSQGFEIARYACEKGLVLSLIKKLQDFKVPLKL